MKKLLAMLLCLCMAAVLFPTAAFADETVNATEVFLSYDSDSDPGITLNATTPYWVNGATSATNDPTGANASFDAATGILKLNGAVIDSETAAGGILAKGNLTVELTGTNTITVDLYGINVQDGKLAISGGKLVVNVKGVGGGNDALYSEFGMTLTEVDLDLTARDDAVLVETGLCSLSDCTGTIKSTDSFGIYVDYGSLSMTGCNMQVESKESCLYGYDSGDGYNNGNPYGIGDVAIKDCIFDLKSSKYAAIFAEHTFFDVESSDITINAIGGLTAYGGSDTDKNLIKKSTLNINSSQLAGIDTLGDLLIHASDVTIKTDYRDAKPDSEAKGIFTQGKLTITDEPGVTGSARHTIDIDCRGTSAEADYCGIFSFGTISLSGSVLNVKGQTEAIHWYSKSAKARAITNPLVLADGYLELNGYAVTDLFEINVGTAPGENYTMAKNGVIAKEVALQPSTFAAELAAENKTAYGPSAPVHQIGASAEAEKEENPNTGAEFFGFLPFVFFLFN